MSDERAHWESSRAMGTARTEYDPASHDLSELRELLLGAERRRLRELERRLDAAGVTKEELAELLPDAIVMRAARDRHLARALAPTVENALGESVRRNPRQIATAIFPILGPAIRKAIAESFANLVASINSVVEHSISPRGLSWRLEAWRTGVPYPQVVLKYALIYRVEQVFLIHAESGLLLGHVAPRDMKAMDADLISGMLTAIRDFVADSFAPERDAGGLRQFCVGELTVMVEAGPQAMLAAVVRGQAPEALLSRLQETLEGIHLQLAAPFAEFAGDTAPFAPATPLLEECLMTALSTDRTRERGKRVAWRPWLAAMLLAALVAGVFMVRSAQRWSRAVSRLEAEPGIVVVRAERDGGRWSFRGLRDPMAAQPSAVLAAMGADTSKVTQRWEPFLSFDREMVMARARRALAPPPTVTLALSGDTLRATGRAPLAWVASRGSVASPAGATVVELGGVEAELPSALAALRSEIERERALFGVGVGALDGAALAAVGRVATAFRRLEAGVAALGAGATIEIVGRSDPTGSDSLNRTLSEVRATSVVEALASRGVSPASVRARAVGTAVPLDARDPAERARINRSVSFSVRVR